MNVLRCVTVATMLLTADAVSKRPSPSLRIVEDITARIRMAFQTGQSCREAVRRQRGQRPTETATNGSSPLLPSSPSGSAIALLMDAVCRKCFCVTLDKSNRTHIRLIFDFKDRLQTQCRNIVQERSGEQKGNFCVK